MKKINYCLRENQLSNSDENLYRACVKNKQTLTQEDMISIMLGKNSTVTRHDIVVVLGLLKESVKEQVLDGYPISMDLFKAGVSIKGGFTSSSDEFDRNRHRVCVNLNASTQFKKDLAYSAAVERVESGGDAPVIHQIFDFARGDFSKELNSGGLVEIRGVCFRSEELATGVFLRLDGAEERVSVPLIHRLYDRSILCNLPEDLEPGDYWLTVVIGEGDDASLGKYPHKLTIT